MLSRDKPWISSTGSQEARRPQDSPPTRSSSSQTCKSFGPSAGFALSFTLLVCPSEINTQFVPEVCLATCRTPAVQKHVEKVRKRSSSAVMFFYCAWLFVVPCGSAM